MQINAIMNRKDRFQSGAGLLEAIAFLGIAAIVIYGAVSLLTSAFGGANANRAVNETVGLRTNIKKTYMGQPAGYGTGSLNVPLTTAKQFPSTLAVSGSTVTNGWNGNVTVDGNTATFTITYTMVPQDVCSTLVSAQGSAGWVSVSINGAAALLPPITPTAAGTACNATNNTIAWVST